MYCCLFPACLTRVVFLLHDAYAWLIWCTIFFGVVLSFSLEEARGLKSRVLLEVQWRLLWFIFILIKLMCYLTALWTLWVCLRRELFGNIRYSSSMRSGCSASVTSCRPALQNHRLAHARVFHSCPAFWSSQYNFAATTWDYLKLLECRLFFFLSQTMVILHREGGIILFL